SDDGPDGDRQASEDRRARGAHGGGEEHAAAVLRQGQEVRDPARRLLPGRRRADSHAEGEAQDRRREVSRRPRRPLPVTSLAGKVAVVTGASRGLGRAIALALAEAGAAV